MSTLFLIPTPLGDAPVEQWMLPGQAERLRPLTHFVVEAAKTARKHLKQLALATPLQQLQLTELNEHTPERELAALRQSAGSLGPGDLEPMMTATGQALQAALPGARPQALEYANNELRLRGIDPAGDALATLQERLATAGYRAQADDSALVVRVEDGQ